MAEIVGVYATSHTPVMLNFPEAIPAVDREAIYAAFRQVGDEIRASRPDTVVVVSDDHLHNFFLDNFPAFCVGAANSYETPAEHWLKTPRRVLRGDGELGAHLIGESMRSGFDPSFSMDLILDHGVLTPMHLAGLTEDVAVVPVIVNCVQPPLPTMQRSLDWGVALGRAIAAFEPRRRVAILATGGISHDVGTPRMGTVNEAFDREFLRLLLEHRTDELVAFSSEHVNEAGNGAEEIRTWLLAHGAAGGAAFEQIHYQAVPQWYTGIALGRWKLNR